MQVIIIILNTIMTWHVIQTPRDVRLSFFIFAIAGLVSVPHAAVLLYWLFSRSPSKIWIDGWMGWLPLFWCSVVNCCCVSRECLFVYYCLDIIRLFCVIYVKVFTLFVFAWADIALCCRYSGKFSYTCSPSDRHFNNMNRN